MRIETDYEMAIIGANRAGRGVAGDAYAAGVEKIILFSKDDSDLARQGVAGEHSLNGHPDWHVGAPVTRLVQHDDHVEIHTDDLIVTSRIVVVAARAGLESAPPPYEIPQAVASRVHLSMPDSAEHSEFDKDADILVIGVGETAAEYCEDLVDSGHSSVVLSLPSVAFDRLATATRNRLREIESRMQATVLWHAHPTGVIDVGGVPMVTFDDRRTPDLIFDHIIFSLGPGQKAGRLERLGIELRSDPVETGSVVVLSQLDDDDTPHVEPVIYVSPGHAWAMIHDTHFPELEPAHDLEARPPLLRYQLAEHLRRDSYNATITAFNRRHGDLWVIRVKPDAGDVEHSPGQYTTLALGYWEPRIDGLDEHLEESKFEKLVRRSYSISYPILDEQDRLVRPDEIDGLEFYIVLVRAEGMDHLPELTPRLALKREGDRIFMGTKITGRYTLKSVTDKESDVILLSTGTGEAPHNNMIAELLRTGHTGRIVSACTVRYQRDLAYYETHRRLEQLYENYTYIPLTTREPETINNKVYIQDLITSGALAEALGHEPTPERSHFFMCGNPLMIGIPERDGENLTFPDTAGVCQILYERGFTIEHRGVAGNVHYEEYW